MLDVVPAVADVREEHVARRLGAVDGISGVRRRRNGEDRRGSEDEGEDAGDGGEEHRGNLCRATIESHGNGADRDLTVALDGQRAVGVPDEHRLSLTQREATGVGDDLHLAVEDEHGAGSGGGQSSQRRPADGEAELRDRGRSRVWPASRSAGCQRGGGTGAKLVMASSSSTSRCLGVRPARTTLSEDAMISTPNPLQ